MTITEKKIIRLYNELSKEYNLDLSKLIRLVYENEIDMTKVKYKYEYPFGNILDMKYNKDTNTIHFYAEDDMIYLFDFFKNDEFNLIEIIENNYNERELFSIINKMNTSYRYINRLDKLEIVKYKLINKLYTGEFKILETNISYNDEYQKRFLGEIKTKYDDFIFNSKSGNIILYTQNKRGEDLEIFTIINIIK